MSNKPDRYVEVSVIQNSAKEDGALKLTLQ